LDIRHLQTIVEIVRANSFTRAAEALHVTQPSISKTIRSLEREINAEVFVRDHKSVKLTEAGETIVRHAAPILRAFEKLETELSDLTYLKKGRLRIGLPPMAGANFFPGVLKSFQEKYPGIAIGLAEEGAAKIEQSVLGGELDAGVVLLPVDENEFGFIPLVRDKLKLVVPVSHRFAERGSIGMSELAEENFILFASGFALHDRIIAEGEAAGFTLRVVYETSQWDFIGEMVASGLGISLLPGTVCRLLNADKVRAVELDGPGIPWHLAMAWKKSGYLSLATREWIAFTRDHFGDIV